MEKTNEVYKFTSPQVNMNFTISEAKTGFVFNYYHPNAPEFKHGLRALVPYGTWGFEKGMDMYSLCTQVCSYGSKFASFTLGSYDHAAKEGNESIRVLRHSYSS